MPIIFENEPLMFVHGPPVFIRVEVADEESTSVFMSTVEEQDVIEARIEFNDAVTIEDDEGTALALENEVVISQEVNVTPVVDPSVRRRIIYLKGSFQKEMYRPLQFDLGDQSLTGAIERVDGDTVFIELGDENQEIIAVDIHTIEEIRWHGQPFAEI